MRGPTHLQESAVSGECTSSSFSVLWRDRKDRLGWKRKHIGNILSGWSVQKSISLVVHTLPFCFVVVAVKEYMMFIHLKPGSR